MYIYTRAREPRKKEIFERGYSHGIQVKDAVRLFLQCLPIVNSVRWKSEFEYCKSKIYTKSKESTDYGVLIKNLRKYAVNLPFCDASELASSSSSSSRKQNSKRKQKGETAKHIPTWELGTAARSPRSVCGLVARPKETRWAPPTCIYIYISIYTYSRLIARQSAGGKGEGGCAAAAEHCRHASLILDELELYIMPA